VVIWQPGTREYRDFLFSSMFSRT